MASGPLPPADLDKRSLPLISLPVGSKLIRIYRLKNDPDYYAFGGGSRFNAPNGQFGTLYLSERHHGAFAETLLRHPEQTFVQRSNLEARGFATFRVAQELRLVQLFGNGLTKIGATAEITSTGDYGLSQHWALALWSHPEEPDGIAYMSRHDNHETCFAVFDRARNRLVLASPRGRSMTSELRILGDVLTYYDVGVI